MRYNDGLPELATRMDGFQRQMLFMPHLSTSVLANNRFSAHHDLDGEERQVSWVGLAKHGSLRGGNGAGKTSRPAALTPYTTCVPHREYLLED